jgi:hypothetical protein
MIMKCIAELKGRVPIARLAEQQSATRQAMSLSFPRVVASSTPMRDAAV